MNAAQMTPERSERVRVCGPDLCSEATSTGNFPSTASNGTWMPPVCHALPLFGVLLLLLLLSSVEVQASTYRLGFGVYSTKKPKETVAHFLPFTKALQAALAERLQQPVEVHIAVMQTYGDGERFIEDGEVDFLELGAAAYVLAREKNADLELLAVRSPSDAKQLAGVICVRTNSPIMNIEQVRGVSMAFGDKRSTTGHFLAQQHLLAQGIKSKDLGRQTHLASHEEVASSVASGQFEAGALNMIAFLQAVRAGKGLRILSRFPNFGRPWICRSSMPAPLKQALKQSLLEVAECPSLGTLEEGDTSMLPADDLDFESLRKAIRENNLFYERSKP